LTYPNRYANLMPAIRRSILRPACFAHRAGVGNPFQDLEIAARGLGAGLEKA
jgi:hypothetical protein